MRLLVVRIDEEGQVTLSDSKGELSYLAMNADQEQPWQCQVVCNPTREWPFLQLPAKKWGMVQFVALPAITGDLQNLVPFEDWVVGEPLRGGGALYVRPTLKLKHMDRLVVFFEKGQTSLIVPKHFFPVAAKAAAAKFARIDITPKSVTVYDHLLRDGLGDDE